MGKIGRIKRVNSCEAPRQAWFCGVLNRCPLYLQLEGGITLTGPKTPSGSLSYLLSCLHRAGEGEGREGSLRGKVAEAQMGRRGERRLGEVHRCWGCGPGCGCASTREGPEMGARRYSRSGRPRRPGLLRRPRLQLPPRPAREELGWGGRPSRGRRGPRKRVSAGAKRGRWRRRRLRKVGPASTCARTVRVSMQAPATRGPLPCPPPRPPPGAPSPSESSRSARSP